MRDQFPNLAALTPFVVVTVLALLRPAWFGDPRTRNGPVCAHEAIRNTDSAEER